MLERAQVLVLRGRLLQCVRQYFWELGYLEVETPSLSPFLIPEPSIEVFPTMLASGQAGYLAPSPELWMKRLVAEGSGSLFQISRCFRNAEQTGPAHQPEFTMLEWYTVGGNYQQAVGITTGLLDALQTAVPRPRSILGRPLKRVTMSQLFREKVGVNLPGASRRDLYDAADRLGLFCDRDDSWEQLFHRLYLSVVEPGLPDSQPVVVMDYPAGVPCLAAPHATEGLVQRWELYAGTLELANCFQEETDGPRLAAVLEQEARRKQHAHVPHPPDLELGRLFAAAPACCGVAMGLDRLLMAHLGAGEISAVNTFTPFSGRVSPGRDRT